MSDPNAAEASDFAPREMPDPPDGPYHLPYGPNPTDWHLGGFSECDTCLVAAGQKEPEDAGPAPMPTHDHDSARQALAELGAQMWTTQLHLGLHQVFSVLVDWTGPVPQYCVRIVPGDGRELDSSSIQELRWDMLAVDPDQVSGKGSE